MAEITRLSKVNIDPADGTATLINVPIAADIDNLFIYVNGQEYTLHKLLFGTLPPSLFTSNSMYNQLYGAVTACKKVLDDNSPFWEGASSEVYGRDSGNTYICSPEDIAEINFYR